MKRAEDLSAVLPLELEISGALYPWSQDLEKDLKACRACFTNAVPAAPYYACVPSYDMPAFTSCFEKPTRLPNVWRCGKALQSSDSVPSTKLEFWFL